MPQPAIFSLRLFSTMPVGRLYLQPEVPRVLSPDRGVQMQPLVFMLSEARAVRGKALGTGPAWQGRIPLPATRQYLSGTSRDAQGNALGGCTCTLLRVNADGSFTQVGQQVSDPTTGAYSFAVGGGEAYRVIFDLAGSPDVAGLTAKNLSGDPTPA